MIACRVRRRNLIDILRGMNSTLRHTLTIVLLGAAAVTTAARADAEVTRVEIATRADVGTTGYEKIVGTIHFAADPKDPHNRVIADIDKAPVNASGKVEFSADLYVLRPKDAARSNGIALIDVVNRGRKMILNGFNRAAAGDPATDPDLGDGFLLRRGYTLVWVGWQFDVRRQNGAIGIQVPSATGVNSLVRAEFTPNERGAQTVADLAAYAALDPAAADTTLTVRDGPFGRATPVARGNWTLQGNTVTMANGFEPGRTYQLAYRAGNLPVAGLGLAAFRDTAAWVKRSPDAVARAQHTIAFGSSQSGRFLRTFLYYGFNTDERGAQVFDGVMAHIAGGAGLSLNERGATPNALSMWAANAFPFANSAARDPITGKVEGVLDNDRARPNQPKIFYTNSSVEYWGGGRSAALIHTSPDGQSDLTLPDNARVYLLTGSQHSPGRFPARVSNGQQPDNPVEYWWTMRALLVGMENWVKNGTAPPASQYPRLADGTLVSVDRVAFPAIPGVGSPRTVAPAHQAGKPRPLLVPQVGEDGNELAGIRTPEVLVPMATYTGWNFRNSGIGGTEHLVSLAGSAVPFATTAAERNAKKDPRRSVEDRYPSADAYMAKVQAAIGALVTGGYLLPDDVSHVKKRAEQQWSNRHDH
jgi:hypothetical protein